jgi:GT2 family glycosyltransferase/glycosyltransferase involved in cell wall biosynthesis
MQPAFSEMFDEIGWPRTGRQWQYSMAVLIPLSGQSSAMLEGLLGSVEALYGPRVQVVLAVFGKSRHISETILERVSEVVEVANNQELWRYLVENRSVDWWWIASGKEVFELTAALEIHAVLQSHPDGRLISFDHDILQDDGGRASPHFTPEHSPDMLLSTPYIGSTYVVSRESLALIPEDDLRNGAEWPWDVWSWSLVWHTSQCETRRMVRIPRVLASCKTVALGEEEWGLLASAARNFVKSAFSGQGIECEIRIPDWAVEERRLVCQPIFSDSGPEVAIIIPTRNKHEVVRTCIESLAKTTYKNFVVYLVDNNSDEQKSIDSFDSLKLKGVKVMHIASPPEGFSYSYVNNRAVEQTSGEPFLLFLNNDTEVIEPRWLSQMVGWAMLPKVGSVGALLYFPNQTVQHAGITHKLYLGMFPAPSFKLIPRGDRGYQDYIEIARDSAAQTAACLLTRRSIFIEFGMFDDVDFKVAYNDCDYGFKLVQGGLRNVYCPDARLFHYEGLTRGHGRGNDKPSEEAAFVRKYARWSDPFYNPNLTRHGTDFSVVPCAPVTVPLSMTRLTVVTHNLNYEGAPLVLLELVRGLLRTTKFQVRVLSMEEGLLRKEYEAIGCDVSLVKDPAALFAKDEASWRPAINDVASMLSQADVVLANTVLTWWAVEAARTIHLPALWVIHESEPPFTHLREHDLDLSRAEIALAYAYKVIFVAWATRDVFRLLERTNNFHVFHNGFDHAAYKSRSETANGASVRARFNIGNDCLLGLLPGVVCERKGQLDLVGAVAEFDGSILERMHFLIVGDRPSNYSGSVHSAIDKLPSERRKMITVVPHCSEMEHYFATADFMVMTSRIEAFPKVIQEAMYYGLPMVVAPVFGIVEQVQDEVSALFVTPGDVKGLAKQLTRIAEDPALRKKLSLNARCSLNRLPNMEDMVDEYRHLIEEASISCPVDPLQEY